MSDHQRDRLLIEAIRRELSPSERELAPAERQRIADQLAQRAVERAKRRPLIIGAGLAAVAAALILVAVAVLPGRGPAPGMGDTPMASSSAAPSIAADRMEERQRQTAAFAETLFGEEEPEPEDDGLPDDLEALAVVVDGEL